MPIYEYVADSGACIQCSGRFELLRRLSEPELRACPRCGQAVHQVISAASVVSGQQHRLQEGHLEKHGFTQYRRAGGGVYEKTAGKGPDFISGD